MKTKLISVATAVSVALAGVAWAGGENVKFPTDYLKFRLYQTLDRHDNKQ